MNRYKAIFTGGMLVVMLTSYAQNSLPIPKPPVNLLATHPNPVTRYTTVWVKGDLDPKNYIRHEQLSNQLLPIKSSTKPITLLIDSTNLDGEFYRRAFLINATGDTVHIDRADATIANIRTEVCVNGQWLTLQKDIGSSCGNSYWTMSLPPNYHLVLQIEPLSGLAKAPYRLIIKANGHEILSNPITINLPQALLDQAGTPFNNP